MNISFVALLFSLSLFITGYSFSSNTQRSSFQTMGCSSQTDGTNCNDRGLCAKTDTNQGGVCTEFTKVHNYKSTSNGALRDVAFTAFHREWNIRLWPNTVFLHGSVDLSMEQAASYWIGTLLNDLGSDVSLTFKADGSIFSAYIVFPTGRQLRILSATDFSQKYPELQEELSMFKPEDLIIFEMRRQQKTRKRQSTPQHSESSEERDFDFGHTAPTNPSPLELNDSNQVAPRWNQSIALFIDQAMIDRSGSFDRASQIVLSAMNDVNLILRHNGIREWSVNTEVRRVRDGVVADTNSLLSILSKFKSYRAQELVEYDPDCSLLVTGVSDLKDGKAGLALVGKSCMKWSSQRLDLSGWKEIASSCSAVVRDIGLYLYSTMAHEVGHLMGSVHVEDSNSNDIMQPRVPLLGLAANRFTCASKTAMTAECSGNIKYSCDPNAPFDENDPAFSNPHLGLLLNSAGSFSILKTLLVLTLLFVLVM